LPPPEFSATVIDFSSLSAFRISSPSVMVSVAVIAA